IQSVKDGEVACNVTWPPVAGSVAAGAGVRAVPRGVGPGMAVQAQGLSRGPGRAGRAPRTAGSGTQAKAQVRVPAVGERNPYSAARRATIAVFPIMFAATLAQVAVAQMKEL